ncbi:MAG: efflux RND transporter periplasmic adaptor subunit [Candidatus Omnitrophica bacterium]|nr:efflux RND transporter periplasmic adaptor subunit [Candidatus Omnitrophota bacterium]MDD5573609.1 efflux RND transporter periplasmic adaptor subunit [Candidatus Omnitrophota bacterium]
MKNKWRNIGLAVLFLVAGIAVIRIVAPRKGADRETVQLIKPSAGTIRAVISTTGTVLPKNRLEIKPPVNGRIESVLVKEGEQVKIGQILAWMSSTERAALLDNARGQGAETLKYWEDAYKPIPLSAPIDGEVIVATTQPGQTVTTSDAVVVLSDHLIVRAQVDETDIGKIEVAQAAVVSLDAYPDTEIKADVEHIYYESETVNNVTIYKADLKPEEVPLFFRSGMNATVDFIEDGEASRLLIPQKAVFTESGGTFVWVAGGQGGMEKRAIKTGLSDETNVEVLSGLNENDQVAVKTTTYAIPKTAETGTNPFMPKRPGEKKTKS